MSTYQIVLFSLFTFVLGLMILDKNVAKAVDLSFKLFQVEVARRVMLVRLRFMLTPVGMWIEKRKYVKMAEQLHQELNQQ